MKKSSRPVVRRALTEEDKVRMALMRFGADNGGRFRSIEDVALVEERNVAVVSRAIAAAFVEGLVTIRPSEAAPVARRSDLERRLRERFSQLRGVIVLNGDVRAGGGSALSHGDRLHRQLGVAMAELVAAGPFFRDRDVIGLGSGRAVFYMVDALARNLPLPVQDVTIGSLTGSVYAQDHSGAPKLIFDADNHTATLASCFRGRVHLEFISHPIAFRPGELEPVRSRTWLEDRRWLNQPPTHALLGVGVLAEGHRLFQELRAERKNAWLEPAMESVKKLVELAATIESSEHAYHPVMDFCNRFYFVEPPVGQPVSAKVEAALRRQIGTLNKCLLTITDTQLRSIDTLVLVAGGRQKARAIAQLLGSAGPKPYRIRYLCTDSDVATVLLAAPLPVGVTL